MSCSRRQFFADLVRAMLVNTAGKKRSPSRGWVRPPGALSEPEFLGSCTRCTDCVQACPHQAIRRLGPEFGECAGTPAIIPQDNPCRLCHDLPCIAACAPQALRPIAWERVDLGTAHLNPAACYRAAGQPCDYCVRHCPLGDSAIDWRADGLPQIHPEGCTGCGMCAHLCPAAALTIEARPDSQGDGQCARASCSGRGAQPNPHRVDAVRAPGGVVTTSACPPS